MTRMVPAPVRSLALSLVLSPVLFLATGEALAHKVNVFAVAEGGRITGEAYFGGGAKAVRSPVEVLDASGRKVAEAVTGQDGTFSLPVPEGAAPPLTLVLKAGDGHGAEFTLEAQDLGQDLGPAAAPARQAASGQTPAPAALPVASPGLVPGLDQAAFKALVEEATAKAVEGKLAPLRLELAKLADQQGAGRLRDIVGGIGWIIGLVGLAAWFKRPRK